MSVIEKFENLKGLIVELRGQSALLDSDVAAAIVECIEGGYDPKFLRI